MEQQTKVVSDMQLSQGRVLQRARQVRLGVRIELITIVWMTIEATIAIVTGFATHSVSLQGFGIDSISELIAGTVLLWRLLIEQRAGAVEVVERAERRASWITALSLFGLAIYIVGDSAFTLLTHSRPQASWWGIGLALAAAIIMPLLWQAKLRGAKRIRSPALKAHAPGCAPLGRLAPTHLTRLLLHTCFCTWWS